MKEEDETEIRKEIQNMILMAFKKYHTDADTDIDAHTQSWS